MELKEKLLGFEVDDIQGFTYGSFSTRFWMLRIGINQLIVDNIQHD